MNFLYIRIVCHYSILKFQSSVLRSNLLKLYPLEYLSDVNDMFLYTRGMASREEYLLGVLLVVVNNAVQTAISTSSYD